MQEVFSLAALTVLSLSILFSVVYIHTKDNSGSGGADNTAHVRLNEFNTRFDREMSNLEREMHIRLTRLEIACQTAGRVR